MASRKEQKEQARARRLAEEQARAEQARRNRRLQMLGGVVIIAVAVVAVAIAVSSGGSAAPNVKVAKGAPTCKNSTDAAVCSLLAGIPQNGTTLGSPKAKITVTEYGDLECPVCRDFALGVENQLISKDVRSGKVRLVYKSLETATTGAPDPGIFGPQQAAAYAAGMQKKAWYYIEFFYHYQGTEATAYVNQTYLNNLAKHVPGLSFNQWLSDSRSQALQTQVKSEDSAARALGYNSTPTITISGPKGQTQPIEGVPNDYTTLESAIDSVA
jgi:protein-disulfide isomerase